jgi:hypothetical protein
VVGGKLKDYRAKVAALATGQHGLGAHQFAKAKAIITEILRGPVPVDPKGVARLDHCANGGSGGRIRTCRPEPQGFPANTSTQSCSSHPGRMPRASTARPLRLSAKRVSRFDCSTERSCGWSKYIYQTTRR